MALSDAGKASVAEPASETSLPPALLASLKETLFTTLSPRDAKGLGDRERHQLALLAGTQLAQRTAGQHKIFIGAGEYETSDRLMPIVLLTEDLPFLVDSATAAVNSLGLQISRLFYPILAIDRDADGNLLSLHEDDAPANTGREALILMEVERAPARTRGTLAQLLERAFDDALAAAKDRQAMHEALLGAGDGLAAKAPQLLAEKLSEASAFVKWLADSNFILLGATNGETSLGILHDQPDFPLPSDDGRESPIVIHHSSILSTVHRTVPLNIVTVHSYDDKGEPAGAWHFAGLFTSAALRENPANVPMVRTKVAAVVEKLGHAPQSHPGRVLTNIIETFPREELFQIDSEELAELSQGLLQLKDRPHPALFARHDTTARSASVLVYLPRDIYSAQLRHSIADMLGQCFAGNVINYDAELRAQGLARIHFVLSDVNAFPEQEELNEMLEKLTRGWNDKLELALAELVGPIRAARLVLSVGPAFSVAYRDRFAPQDAANDILALTGLSSTEERHVTLYRKEEDPAQSVRVKIYRLGDTIALSDSVPILEKFGFRVISETSFDLRNAQLGWIHDFHLEPAQPVDDFSAFRARVQPALQAVLERRQENCPFNALIANCNLEAEEANWLRAIYKYLWQTGTSHSVSTVASALQRNPEVAQALVQHFRATFSPDNQQGNKAELSREKLATALDNVESVDDDRVLRLFEALFAAILRTNAFAAAGQESLAFKFDCARIPWLPSPRPWREIFVYSPRVEGVHLRGGPIARGGLRWSDRQDDFRTEVLGLMKAQMVKNSVIVPTGAKGGFFPKQLSDPAVDRDAWATEGREAYKVFIRSLLSVTDNLDKNGDVIPAENVVALDDPDPYLVVAADKGTASFSDTANEISHAHDFWLGDAFASGGSVGYDHKGMAITARGAWVSVTRHFAEMGVDVQKDPIRVMGVGDMSGDVFGNGMLRSDAIKLVAAFDHRHIFIDPDPDPAKSFQERQRLFDLPRSSWDDYNRELISAGGGIFPRSQKSIMLTPEIKALLDVDADALPPVELISAILKAPLDLLWFGGIGTYIKGSQQTNQDAGDRANDALRVNGADLRVKVIGEGANLGATQAGRIEFALNGGRNNADFIDNSGGVDASDHEVNIKIALDNAVRNNRLQEEERRKILAEMTDEVADLVLANNRAQTRAISVAESTALQSVERHIKLMDALEASGRLDRAGEGLPTTRDLSERRQLGLALTRPELALLLSYAKIDLKQALAKTDLAKDPLTKGDLAHAFPAHMHERFAEDISGHALANEIVATRIANLLVNRGGASFAHDLAAEIGCEITDIASAFVVAREVYGFTQLWKLIDNAELSATVALKLHAETARIIQQLVADVAGLKGLENPSQLAKHLSPGIERLRPHALELLQPRSQAHLQGTRQQFEADGVPDDVVDEILTLQALAGVASVVDLATEFGTDEVQTTEAYMQLGESLGLGWIKGQLNELQLGDEWERLLAASSARQCNQMRYQLIRTLVQDGGNPLDLVAEWTESHASRIASLANTISNAQGSGSSSLAMIAHLVAQAQAVVAD